MLKKLFNCGVRGKVFNWFQSYLSDRKQCVKINLIYSEFGIIKHGVPQGSVLGAILFLIYINDLCNGSFCGNLTSFADDTALCYVKDDWVQINQAMNADAEALQWWFSNNHMLLSADKTKYINFTLRKELSFTEVFYKCVDCLSKPETICTAKCTVVGKTTTMKYLGVILDFELNWKNQIANLKSKLNNTVRYFYFVKSVCSEKVMRMLYFSLVHSRIDYGLSCWGGTYDSSLKPIFIQQKHFVRLISKKSKMHPSYPLFVINNILPLKHMFIYKVLKVFYNKSGNLPAIQSMYKGSLRNPKTLLVPKPSLTFFEKCFVFQGPRIYNQLPVDLKQCTNFNFFQKKLKSWLM